MRKISLLISIILFLVTLLSCNKNEFSSSSEFDGNYEGLLTISRQYSFNGSLSNEMTDTFNLSVSIQNFQFEKPSFGEGENCTGSVEIEEDKISFSSDECPCFCQCNPDPLADCSGDLILGQYHFELQENLIKMWNHYEYTDSFSLNGIISKYFESKNFELSKE